MFTAEELRQLINVARADFPLEIYVLVLTLARTGLRPGEGRCLQVAILVIEVHRPTADRHLAAEWRIAHRHTRQSGHGVPPGAV